MLSEGVTSSGCSESITEQCCDMREERVEIFTDDDDDGLRCGFFSVSLVFMTESVSRATGDSGEW